MLILTARVIPALWEYPATTWITRTGTRRGGSFSQRATRSDQRTALPAGVRSAPFGQARSLVFLEIVEERIVYRYAEFKLYT